MEDKWLNDIKEKLSDFEMDVPAGLWESLQAKGADRVPVPSRSSWRLRCVAAAVAVVAASGLWVAVRLWNDSPEMDMNRYIAEYLRSGGGQPAPAVSGGSALADAGVAGSTGAATGNITGEIENGKLASGGRRRDAGPAVADSSVESCQAARDENEVSVAGECGETTEGDITDAEDVGAKQSLAKKLSVYNCDPADILTAGSSGRHVRKNGRTGHGKVSVGIMTGVGAQGISGVYGGDGSGDGISSGGSSDPGVNNPGTNNPGTNNPGTDNNGPGTDNPPDDESNSSGIEEGGGDNPEDEGKISPDQKMRSASGLSGGNTGDGDRRDDEISHHLPVRIGMTFLYRMNDRLGLETGVVYTCLASDIRYGSDNVTRFREARQKAHYIGIPLSIKYIPFSNRWISLYLSGGAMVEKCVGATLKGMRVDEAGRLLPRATERLDDRPFHLSVNASAGVQFNITGMLGIYAEPGISYYFDTGSSLTTLYTERPLNFNLNVGLRLSFGH